MLVGRATGAFEKMTFVVNSFSLNVCRVGKEGGSIRLCMFLWLFVFCVFYVYLKYTVVFVYITSLFPLFM